MYINKKQVRSIMQLDEQVSQKDLLKDFVEKIIFKQLIQEDIKVL